MRNRFVRNLMAASLAAALLFGSITGVAAAEVGENGVVEAEDTTVVLQKGIVMYNTEGENIYQPTISYSYEISPETVATGITVTDDHSVTGRVHSGVTGGLVLGTSTVTFSNSDTTTTTAFDGDGVEVKKTISATVDLSKFTTPGIYRYSITESVATADLTKAGISRDTDNYNSKRYIDVYIGNADSGEGFKVLGYVCFISDGADKIIDGANASNDQIIAKSQGFVNTYDTNSSTPGTTAEKGHADTYYTYNVTVTKNIEGTLADKTHKFPFEINETGVTGQPFSVTTTADAGDLSLSDAGAASGSKEAKIGTAFTANLTDDKEVKLIGLPANTKISKVEETNDTLDVYSTDIKIDGTTDREATSVAADGKIDITGAKAVSAYGSCDDVEAAQSVTAFLITNTLSEVSPTGLMFRYGPYIILLGAGLLLLALMHRRRSGTD